MNLRISWQRYGVVLNNYGPTVGYGSLMLIGAGLGFAKLFLLGRILSKGDFGQYAYLASLIQYAAPFVGIGIVEGMSRRVPLLLGEGRTTEANQLRSASLGMLLSVSGALVMVLAGTVIFQVMTDRSVPVIALLAALNLISFMAFSFGLRDVRSRLHSLSYAGLMIGRGALDLVGVAYVAPRFGVTGVLISETIVLTLLALFVIHFFALQIRVSLSGFREILPVMRDGGLLVIGGILSNTALMGDRLVLGWVLPKAEYAVYAFHMLVVNTALIFSNIIYQYVSPRLLNLYGINRDSQRILHYIHRLFFVVLILAAIGGFPFVALIGRFAQAIFPAYTINKLLFVIIYAAAAVEVANVYPMALVVVGKMWTQIIVNLFASFLIVGATTLIVRRTHDPLYFGLIFLSGRLAVFGASLILAKQGLGAKTSKA